MQFETHPLYKDPAQVKNVTQGFVNSGHTVFQLFQFGGGERTHSLQVLSLANLPPDASVLSLGCGVAGMEAHWQSVRPDLSFELVNLSQEQLDLSLCSGHMVCADAEAYVSQAGDFDCVVVAYMLGHVDALKTLRSALGNLRSGGKLVVLDVFDASILFNETLAYSAPSLAEVERFAVDHDMRLRVSLQGGFSPAPEVLQMVAPHVLAQATPGMFVLEAK